jgi:NitT/TauT family transport system substrate-binding protein
MASLVGAAAIAFASLAPAEAAEQKEFKVCWTIYVGWMPWGYMQDTGIMKKWADKYGIKVDIVQINDYVESINQYTAGKFDGCTMTNMDALTIPAAGGVDSTSIITGDFSNGNDGIVLKSGKSLADLKGQKINLVEFSVSHYLLARALGTAGLTERDIKTVNTSDADIVAAFSGSADVTSVVTWNPQLQEVVKVPGSVKVFNSSQIPGEIMDLMVLNTKTIGDNPKLGKALIGAWYETINLMRQDDAAGKAAREAMAKASGTDLAGFEAQLKTTRMFYTPAEAVQFTESRDIVKTMDYIRVFSFDHQLLGGVKNKFGVGMEFPDGSTLGDRGNVKLRFDSSFMTMGAQGKL